MFRVMLTLVALLISVSVTAASEKHDRKDDPQPKYRGEASSERPTSRQKIIDAAQVYCQGGTPFDRVHGYLRAFWGDDVEDADQRQVTCKLR